MMMLLQKAIFIGFFMMMGSVNFPFFLYAKENPPDYKVERCVRDCYKKALETFSKEKKLLSRQQQKQQVACWTKGLTKDSHVVIHFSALENIKMLRKVLIIKKRKLNEEETDDILNSIIVLNIESPFPQYIEQAKDLAIEYYRELKTANSYKKQSQTLKKIVRNAEETFRQRISRSCSNICNIRNK